MSVLRACRQSDWQGTAAPALRQTPAALFGGLHPGDLPTLLLRPLHHPTQVRPAPSALTPLKSFPSFPSCFSALALVRPWHLLPAHDTRFLPDLGLYSAPIQSKHGQNTQVSEENQTLTSVCLFLANHCQMFSGSSSSLYPLLFCTVNYTSNDNGLKNPKTIKCKRNNSKPNTEPRCLLGGDALL